jgi:hypothetical protein
MDETQARLHFENILNDPSSSPSMKALARMRLRCSNVLGENATVIKTGRVAVNLSSLDSLYDLPSHAPAFMRAVQQRWVDEVLSHAIISRDSSLHFDLQQQIELISTAAECLFVADSVCTMIATGNTVMPSLEQAARNVLLANNVSPKTKAYAHFVLCRIQVQHDVVNQVQNIRVIVNHLTIAALNAPNNPMLLTAAANFNVYIGNKAVCLQQLKRARAIFENAKKQNTETVSSCWWTNCIDRSLLEISFHIGQVLVTDADHTISKDFKNDEAIKELTAAVVGTYRTGVDTTTSKDGLVHIIDYQTAGERMRYRGDGCMAEYMLSCLEHDRGHFSKSRKWFVSAEKHELQITNAVKQQEVANSIHKLNAQVNMKTQMEKGFTSGSKFSENSIECAHCQIKPEKGQKFRKCSQCKRVFYCCPDHQKKHWKKGGHKKECKQLAQQQDTSKNEKNSLKQKANEKVKQKQNEMEMVPFDALLTPEMCWSKGLSLMNDGDFEDAIFHFLIAQFLSWEFFEPNNNRIIIDCQKKFLSSLDVGINCKNQRVARNIVPPAWILVLNGFYNGIDINQVVTRMEELCRLAPEDDFEATTIHEITKSSKQRLVWATGYLFLMCHRTKTQIRSYAANPKATAAREGSEKVYNDTHQASLLTHRASKYINGNRWITMAFELAYTSRDAQAWDAADLWSGRMQKMGKQYKSKSKHWTFFLDRDLQGQKVSTMAKRSLGIIKKVKKQKPNNKCDCGSGKKYKKCCGKK